MKRKHLFFIYICCMLMGAMPLRAQVTEPQFGVPFDFPLLLSGNFGELRSNHFHGGLDFKTQGVTGKPLLAIADGYISKVTVTAGGYGNALYITHDNGYTSVHGHLDHFLSSYTECSANTSANSLPSMPTAPPSPISKARSRYTTH